MVNYWILSLAVIGFVLSGYIYYKKKQNEQLVCVVGKDCNAVINSKYGTLFGIENTILGMLYFGGIMGLTIASSLFPKQELFVWATIIISSLAALFSVYLTFVQIKILKEWCEYCLISAGLSIVIFVLSVL